MQMLFRLYEEWGHEEWGQEWGPLLTFDHVLSGIFTDMKKYKCQAWYVFYPGLIYQ